jgi:hypothetical protein
MLVTIGPLVGVSFINAVRSYAEVSVGAGPGCGVVCAPLLGIWAPTFSAYEVAAIFLLPFVAIRAVSGDRQSGALKLELQQVLSPAARILGKAAVLLAGWSIAGLPALVAVALWMSYGGSLYGPEMAVVVSGHLLNGGLTVGLAVAIASMTDHASTAAIVTLAVTIGTWLIDFAAAVRGGAWTRLAAYTPSAMVATFQHGLVQANVVAVVIVLIVATLSTGAVWMRLGVSVRRRACETAAVVAGAALLVAACAFGRGSWDASEGRVNSFPEAEETALMTINAPLTVEIHLAPQDPRRTLFERGPLAKLRRAVPHVRVTEVARTASGLFEQSDPGYGEIRYELGNRRAASRVITDEGVLEEVLDLAGVTPTAGASTEYAGHPLDADPAGAALLFYAIWPAAAGGAGIVVLRRHA